MEFLLSFNLVSSIILLAFTLALINHWRRSNKKLPPSPWKLPVIGNLHNLMGSSPPHYIVRDLSNKYGPLMHLQLGEISTVIVSSSGIAEKVMKSHDLAFSDRAQFLGAKIILYNCSDIALSPYGEYWRQLRKIYILELLSARNVRSFGSIRSNEASRMIESIKEAAGGGAVPINLTGQLSEFSSCMICRAAFGRVSKEDRQAFLDALEEALSVTATMDVEDLFPSIKVLHPFLSFKKKLLRIHKKFDEVMERIIDQHIENLSRTKQGMGEWGQEDLVDVLLRVKQSGEVPVPITKDNIKAIILDAFIGATGNPSATMEWAMAEMMRAPEVMAKAQDEIRKAFPNKETPIEEADVQKLKYLKLVIKETLRMHPPLPFLVPKECREECEIDGYTIPVKTMVMVNVWAIGRDPEYWEDPEKFKPERFESISADYIGSNFHYLPFGAGRRACAGISFGLANVELPLALMLYHFDWKLAPSYGENGVDFDMSESTGMTVTLRNNLQLLAKPYHP